MARTNQKIVLIVHDVRSAHNVGSLLRTADGLGVEKIYFSGYTPYPRTDTDTRLPHIQRRLTRQISKTALGADKSVIWEAVPTPKDLISRLRKDRYLIAALEQAPGSQSLPKFKTASNIALLLGNEVVGLDDKTLKLVDVRLEIPMLGRKESFNVTIAAAIALYHIRYVASQLDK